MGDSGHKCIWMIRSWERNLNPSAAKVETVREGEEQQQQQSNEPNGAFFLHGFTLRYTWSALLITGSDLDTHDGIRLHHAFAFTFAFQDGLGSVNKRIRRKSHLSLKKNKERGNKVNLFAPCYSNSRI